MLLFAFSFSRVPASEILIGSLMSMGSAGLLGIAVWYCCKRLPWPLRFSLRFYAQQLGLALLYTAAWTAAIYAMELWYRPKALQGFLSLPVLSRQLLIGIWLYTIFAGISYAIQTRISLHEKETLAARARLDAVRARLNPHFLFNALHTLAALVKFRPPMAEGAIERLGDMLRYTLKEDGRELVEFSEEMDFTKQYLSFEQLRYEDRLKVDIQIDPQAFNFDIPPFSIQTLAENAVHHAISVRPEGGSIWIHCSSGDDRLTVSVRDDGSGDAGHVWMVITSRLLLPAAGEHEPYFATNRGHRQSLHALATGTPAYCASAIRRPAIPEPAEGKRTGEAVGFRPANAVVTAALSSPAKAAPARKPPTTRPPAVIVPRAGPSR